MTRVFPLCLLLGFGVFFAHADNQVPVTPGQALEGDARQGWYFYFDPEKRREAEREAAANAAKVPEPNQRDCTKSDQWEASCGFVNPGNDFAFQAKQRDALMQQFAMQASNPKAVEAFQRYQAWVTDQAITASNVWVWNQTQNTDLDAAVSNPISALGLTLAAKSKNSSAKELMASVKKAGGRLLLFSRTNCDWCHQQVGLTSRVVREYNLPLWNVTLDATCLPGMASRCISGPLALALAKELNIRIVPAQVLFIPDNTWIKIASGITVDSELRARLVNFLAAYKGALQESTLSDAPVKPDFSQMLKKPTGTAAGTNP